MAMITIGDMEIELGKFHPHLNYVKDLGLLQVVLRDCSRKEVVVSKCFDVLMDNHPKKSRGEFVGFNLWGVHGVLNHQDYKRGNISLETLIKRFKKARALPFGQNVFGRHEEKIIAVARKYQFVWWINK